MIPEVSQLRHLVIIPDGNGRWAQKHNLEIGEGHLRGAFRAQQLVEWVLPRMDDLGIDVFTFWGFSTENWSKSEEEVSGLMRLTENSLVDRTDQLINSGVRFKHIGRKDSLPHSLIEQMDFLEGKTTKGSKTFILALNYGGRDEIIRAISKVGEKSVNEETFKQYLDTAGLPDPDLIIRTAGEMRTSGIYPYQAIYAEFVSSPVFFPDFDEGELRRCLDEYYKRNRRFGTRPQLGV